MSDSPPPFVAEMAGTVVVNPSVISGKIYEKAAELALIEKKIEAAEEELQRLKDDRAVLSSKELPELFDQVQTDHLGVPGWEADVVLKSGVHANIKTEWDEEKQRVAYDELERLGGSDLIKVTVSVSFAKGDIEVASDLKRYIERWNMLEGREVLMKKGVAWNTLTKFVSEQMDRGTPVKLDLIGGSTYRSCVIEWRGQRKKRGRV